MAQEFFGRGLHVGVKHGVEMGGYKASLVGSADALIIVENINRFDEHLKPVGGQENVGSLDDLSAPPLVIVGGSGLKLPSI